MIEIESDLRAMFGPVRDQGPRPTCLAFAASDAHAALRAGWEPLSAEYAFYRAQQRAGRSPHQGAMLGAMLEGIEFDGQPVEADWPYLATLPADLAQWHPPGAPRALFARRSVSGAAALPLIRAVLARGSPALVIAMLSASFFRPSPQGVVKAPAGELPDPAMVHAMVALASGRVDGEPAILVRNSWGPGWGAEGHAWLTDMFLGPRIAAMACLTENCDVSGRSAAA